MKQTRDNLCDARCYCIMMTQCSYVIEKHYSLLWEAFKTTIIWTTFKQSFFFSNFKAPTNNLKWLFLSAHTIIHVQFCFLMRKSTYVKSSVSFIICNLSNITQSIHSFIHLFTIYSSIYSSIYSFCPYIKIRTNRTLGRMAKDYLCHWSFKRKKKMD